MSKFKLLLRYKNEKGYTLVVALMVLMVFSVLGISLMAMSMNSVKMSAGEREDQSVFYIAEAALNTEMEIIEKEVNQIYSTISDENTFYSNLLSSISKTNDSSAAIFEKNSGHLPRAEISVIELNKNNPRDFRVTSKGYIDKKSRTVTQDISIEWVPKSGGSYTTAVLVKEKITISNGTINGDIATTSKGTVVDKNGNTINVSPSIVATGGNVHGSIYASNDYVGNPLSKLSWMNSFPNVTRKEIGEFPSLPEFPAIPNLTFAQNRNLQNSNIAINDSKLSNVWRTSSNQTSHTIKVNESTRFKEILLTSNANLYLDLDKEDKAIVVDHLNLTNGHIHIVNGGNLTIYVTGEFTMGNGSTINNNGISSQINIFLKGSKVNGDPKNFTLSGSQKIFGSLYAENANINLTAGGGFNGNIFTGGKEISVSGGTWTTSPLILAPNARFAHTNGSISGVIIANSYEMSGGANTKFDEIDIKVGPISPGGIPQNNSSGKLNISRKVLVEE